jgi:hypothetical protein
MFYSTDNVEAHIASNPHLLPKNIKAPTCTNSASWRAGALKSSAAKARSMGAKKKATATTTTSSSSKLPAKAAKAASTSKATARAGKAAAAASAAAAAASADDSSSDQNDEHDENDDDIDIDNDDNDEQEEEEEEEETSSQQDGLVFEPIALGNSVLSMSARVNCSQKGPRRSRRAFEAAGSSKVKRGNCLAFCMVSS